MNNKGTYFQLGDGFEFILPMELPIRGCATLPFMAHAIYDFTSHEWKKYAITVCDKDCVIYQWRSGEMESRRSNFDDVPVLTMDKLRELGYLMQRDGSSAYLMNKNEYGKRRTAFIERVKALPTTVNLGVDEEMKAVMAEYEAREEEQEEQPTWTPPRNSGRTYIQLGDGFEFIVERPVERVNQMMKLSSASLYDMVDNKWCKYRSTIYKDAEGKLHSTFHADPVARPRNFDNVPVMTYDDLVKAGYMKDWGENVMVRYFFDYQVYQRRRQAANLIFDNVIAQENETGTTE